MKKLKVAAVSYLNTKPLLFGLVQDNLDKYIDLKLDIPSECARKLETGEVDLGLVPVAVIPHLSNPHIISEYCIGTVGAVETVCIYSECPIEELTEVYLDFHSRTSVELAQILIKEYWKFSPQFLQSTEGYINKIGGKIGGLVIGDRTIGLNKRFPYVYDLGEAWMKHTGLPFVFAAWVSNKKLPNIVIEKLNAALRRGVEHIPQLMYILPSPHPDFDLEEYFTHYISYELDKEKCKALAFFLEKLKEGTTKKMVWQMNSEMVL